MIHWLCLIPAILAGAVFGVVLTCLAVASGEKYNGEMYEHDRQILLRRINRLEREIKALRGQSKETGGDHPCGT